MDTKQTVQELKSERVQSNLVVPVRKELLFTDVADEPCWISLKAERVELPADLAGAVPRQLTLSLELAISQQQPMTIETAGTVIKLHGTLAANGEAGGGKVPSSAGQPEKA